MASDLALYEGQHRQSYMRNAFLNRQLWKSKLQQGERRRKTSAFPQEITTAVPQTSSFDENKGIILNYGFPTDKTRRRSPLGRSTGKIQKAHCKGYRVGHSKAKNKANIVSNKIQGLKTMLDNIVHQCLCPSDEECAAGHGRRSAAKGSRPTRAGGASCQCEPKGLPPYRHYRQEHSKCPARMNKYERTKVPEEAEFECWCPQQTYPTEQADVKFVTSRKQLLTDTRMVPTPCPAQCARRPCYTKKVLVSLPYMSCRCAAYAQGRYKEEEQKYMPIITAANTKETRPATNQRLIEDGSYCGVEFRHVDNVRPTPRLVAARRHGICPGHDPRYRRRRPSPAAREDEHRYPSGGRREYFQDEEPVYEHGHRKMDAMHSDQPRPSARSANDLHPLRRSISRTLQFVEFQPTASLQFVNRPKDRLERRTSRTLIFPFDPKAPEPKRYSSTSRPVFRSVSCETPSRLPYAERAKEAPIRRSSKTLIFPFEGPPPQMMPKHHRERPLTAPSYYERLVSRSSSFQYPAVYEVPEDKIREFQNVTFYQRI